MMETEFLANFCEKQLQLKLENFNDSEVIKFTESVRHGVRYIAFKQNDKTFLIEIKVEQVDIEEA